MADSSGDYDRGAKLAAFGVLLERVLHDLKHPLNLIRVVAQDLRLDVRKNRFDVASLEESMSTVEIAVDELTARLDRLRSFARGSDVPASEVSTDVGVVCRSVVARAREEWPDRLEIIEALEPSLPAAHIDPLGLEMAIWELVENAVWAGLSTGTTTCSVRVSAEARGPNLVVSVRDDGGGSPEEIRASIFEPFFTTREGAPGLGLALTRELVQRAGGELALAESSSPGALFELRLRGRG